LIEDAKKLLDVKRVQMDKLIAELQKEKSSIQKINEEQKRAQKKADDAERYYKDLQNHLHQQLEKAQTQLEFNNKYIQWGQKVEQFLTKMKNGSASKPFMEELRKFFIVEKSKMIDAAKRAKLKKSNPASVKKKIIKSAGESISAPLKPVVVGAKVRLDTGSEIGEVLEISGKNAIVLFGNFQTKTQANRLVAV
jgi:DNA mismatch repair protein MutS2